MKQTAKDAMLARIRKALANAPEPPPVPHDFLERDERDRTVILEELIDRLVDYKALVTRTDDASLPPAIVAANGCGTIETTGAIGFALVCAL